MYNEGVSESRKRKLTSGRLSVLGNSTNRNHINSPKRKRSLNSNFHRSISLQNAQRQNSILCKVKKNRRSNGNSSSIFQTFKPTKGGNANIFHGGVLIQTKIKDCMEAVDEQGEASGEGGAEKNDKAFEQIDQLFGFLNGLYKNTNRSKELNTETHASSRTKRWYRDHKKTSFKHK